jgi:hypothetical protein
MKNTFCILLCLVSLQLFQQSAVNYYKTYNTPIGTSAISINTLSAKTFSFSHPVYKMAADSSTGNLIVSTRQKDASGKSYTNKGFHLTIKQNDSACCLLEDTKLDIQLSGEHLILSNDKRSSRFNKTLGYEQVEFPSKIIYTIEKNNSGLTYNPAIKSGTETALSCIQLGDGAVIWSAPVTGASDWNDVAHLNDSTILIAAGGLHAVNIHKGLVWSYPLTTFVKTDKPLTYSAFNKNTYDKNHEGIITSKEENKITQISSSILIGSNAIYFAAKDRIIALDKTGKLLWQSELSKYPVSRCILQEIKDNIVLVNLGVAQYNDNTVLCGKPFVMAFNKHSGSVTLNMNDEFSGSLTDVTVFKNTILIGDKSLVMEVNEEARVNPILNLYEPKFGRLLEFINGNDYYVEKEGYYVSLNFINDNVVYFKTDHGKVFGMDKGGIEYEYHFTELYKINKTMGGKKLLSQKNKTILVSENFELLHTFTTGEPAVVLKDRIYFADGKQLFVIDVNNLK